MILIAVSTKTLPFPNDRAGRSPSLNGDFPADVFIFAPCHWWISGRDTHFIFGARHWCQNRVNELSPETFEVKKQIPSQQRWGLVVTSWRKSLNGRSKKVGLIGYGEGRRGLIARG
ncbi:MAG: hypothetical protein ACPGLY_17585 [Rubripirellula sp.]